MFVRRVAVTTLSAALAVVCAPALAGCGSNAFPAGAGNPGNRSVDNDPVETVYCGGGDVQRRIEFTILENPQDKWDVRVTVDGETMRAMTAYSYFGKSQPPRGFVVALLREDRSELLVFRDGDEDWLEFGDYSYRKCN